MKSQEKIFPILVFTFAMIAVLSGCKKDGSAISIEGFHLVDAVGNMMGHYGPADDDWTLKNTLSARELALFEFAIDSTLANTVEGNVNITHGYPNPFAYVQGYGAQSTETVIFKLVVVDNNLKVMQAAYAKFKGYKNFQIDYSDQSKFPDRRSFRVYYSFSAQGAPNFKVGYGDIRKCQSSGSGSAANCF